MQSLEQLRKSLADVNHDIEITKRQFKSVPFCLDHSLDISRIFAAKDGILHEQLFDLKCAKLDLERQIKELEEK